MQFDFLKGVQALFFNEGLGGSLDKTNVGHDCSHCCIVHVDRSGLNMKSKDEKQPAVVDPKPFGWLVR